MRLGERKRFSPDFGEPVLKNNAPIDIWGRE